MTENNKPNATGATRTIISVDAMGGDRGPAAVVAGVSLSATKYPDVDFLLHGRKAELEPLIAKSNLTSRVTMRHADEVVTMEDKPAQIMRNGQKTSMWSTISAVRDAEASGAVSCGNTGALMAVSMIRLRKLPSVNRPAIACLWPSKNPSRFNIMLDVGADIRADEQDLLQFATMGSSYARNGLDIAKPRVGLLNVGAEETKGRPELKVAFDLMNEKAEIGNFEFVGFVEGGDIPSSRVDVIVTDGFTGNVALKTGEGTSTLISDFLNQEFRTTILSRIAAVFALPTLKRLTQRIDPRLVNGGVFLGLNGTVIKSHGSADATGISAAINLAIRLAESRFDERLAARVASAASPRQDDENSDNNKTGETDE